MLPDDEVIILHGENGALVDYEDTPEIVCMRENLERINLTLTKANIALDINDDQVRELTEIYGQQTRLPLDFNRKTLHRVFNNESFKLGGRFYGGWWEELPSRFRKHIQINYGHTVEIDYSGHHIRILYAREGIEAEEDPFAIRNCPFARKHLKLAALIVLNASSRTSALQALNNYRLGIDTKAILNFFETHFVPISKYFYTGVGLELQYQDSTVAERVILRMMDLGAVVLPIHDSFIVRYSYVDELMTAMNEEFYRAFGHVTFLKRDETVRDLTKPKNNPESHEVEFVTDDLNELLNMDTKTWFRNTFGNRG